MYKKNAKVKIFYIILIKIIKKHTFFIKIRIFLYIK